jgi:hypothetical protein
MKKNIFIALLAIGASVAAQAQTAWFTNATPCEMYVFVASTNSSSCTDNSASIIVIPGSQVTPLGFDMYTGGANTPLSWGWPPSGSFSFFKYHEGDPASCPFVHGSSSCGKGGLMSYSAVDLCGPNLTSCIEISTSGCNMGCAPGNFVTATLTNLGGGDVQVDFNYHPYFYTPSAGLYVLRFFARPRRAACI